MINFQRVFFVTFVALAACQAADAGAILDDSTEQKFAVGNNPTLTVRNTDGRVYVYGADDNEITVKVYKRAFTKERLDKISAKISHRFCAGCFTGSLPPIRRRLSRSPCS